MECCGDTIKDLYGFFFSPAMGIIAYRIKKEDGGPVFYKQVRVGKNGR